MLKPKILLIPDVPDWIFARHCQMLERFLGDEFNFTMLPANHAFAEKEYDLIYPLEFNLVAPEQIQNPAKYVTAVRSHIMWMYRNFFEVTQLFRKRFQRVHVVSQRLYKLFAPHVPGLVRLSHGVDTDFFCSDSKREPAAGTLKLGWAGNRENEAKGFEEFVEPLGHLPGVELVFCGYKDKKLNLHEMRDFYQSLDAYICTSSSEGNNNALMEAAAMQRAIITTDNGTVPEYLKHQESALIVPREPKQFLQAVLQLRDNPNLRVSMGATARAAVVASFDWKKMAEGYRTFFRDALSRPSSSKI